MQGLAKGRWQLVSKKLVWCEDKLKLGRLWIQPAPENADGITTWAWKAGPQEDVTTLFDLLGGRRTMYN